MKAHQMLSIIFIFASSAYSMQQTPANNILLNMIMKNAFSIEKNITSDGIFEYRATLIDQDQLVCKKNRLGNVEAFYLLFLHRPADRKKTGGNPYEKIDLDSIKTQPHAVLKAMQKKYKEQNNTINKHFCTLT